MSDQESQKSVDNGSHNVVGSESSTQRSRTPLNVVQLAVLVGLVLLSYTVFSRLGVQVVEVMGDSMRPTLHQSDHYLLKKWVYLFRSPERNEIVVLSDPDDHGFSVKRVIATEGETVLLHDGKVYVDGKELDEPYLAADEMTWGTTTSGDQTFQLGENEYFVLGDNRCISVDSRTYGPVPKQNILGLILP